MSESNDEVLGRFTPFVVYMGEVSIVPRDKLKRPTDPDLQQLCADYEEVCASHFGNNFGQLGYQFTTAITDDDSDTVEEMIAKAKTWITQMKSLPQAAT